MTTYPQPGDPVSALTRADGTTEAHTEDHSHVIGLPVNAKKYLRGDGVTESQAAINAFAAACAGKVGYFPRGTYAWPDGVTMNISTKTQYRGAGPNAVTITTKDAYAFTTTGTAEDVVLADIGQSCRTGSVSGGLIKAVGVSNGWQVHRVLSNGVATNLTPLIKLTGFVGSYIQKFRVATNGGHGIELDSSPNVCNQWRIAEGSVNANAQAGTAYAGLHITNGGSLGVIEMNDFESNRGRGIWFDTGGGQSMVVRSNWFEDNWFTSIDVDSYSPVIITDCSFQEPHNPQTALTRHIKLANTSGSRIEGNHFYGPNNGTGTPPVNVVIEVASTAEYTQVSNNANIYFHEPAYVGTEPVIQDNGSRTTHFGQNISSKHVGWKLVDYGKQVLIRDPAVTLTDPPGSEPTDLLVAQGTDGFMTINAAGHYTQNLSAPPYVVMDAGTDGLQFQTTAAATVAVGSLVKKLPIYNKGGTLLGYIPIYSSIT